jgi:hypothetical protein
LPGCTQNSFAITYHVFTGYVSFFLLGDAGEPILIVSAIKFICMIEEAIILREFFDRFTINLERFNTCEVVFAGKFL